MCVYECGNCLTAADFGIDVHSKQQNTVARFLSVAWSLWVVFEMFVIISAVQWTNKGLINAFDQNLFINNGV